MKTPQGGSTRRFLIREVIDKDQWAIEDFIKVFDTISGQNYSLWLYNNKMTEYRFEYHHRMGRGVRFTSSCVDMEYIGNEAISLWRQLTEVDPTQKDVIEKWAKMAEQAMINHKNDREAARAWNEQRAQQSVHPTWGRLRNFLTGSRAPCG
jgi:hypothetical protein